MTDNADRVAEATLYDDPATADLAAKVSEAWTEFGRDLAEALPALSPGVGIDLTLDPTAAGIGEAVYAVNVVMSDTSMPHLLACAVSNSTLPPEHRLGRTAVGELIALGWSPPGVVAGSEESFGLHLSVDQASRLAAVITRTLRQVYGTPHPAFLVYAATGSGPESVDLPPLGAARPAPKALTSAAGALDLAGLDLPDQVSTVLAAMLSTTVDKLPVDKDGDVGIRSGSAMVFVRVRDNPPLVDVFSPVLTQVTASERLYVKLSELTHRMPIGRLYYADDTVWASVPVLGRNFQATHLMLAVQVMTGLADELDDRLHGEFGGRRFFTDGDHVDRDHVDHRPADGGRPHLEATADRTGMYL